MWATGTIFNSLGGMIKMEGRKTLRSSNFMKTSQLQLHVEQFLLKSTWRLQKQLLYVVFLSLSSVQLFVMPWTAAQQVSVSFTISWSLLRLMSIALVMPSCHFILCSLLLLLPSIFPSIRVFSKVLAVCIRWPKYWSFSLSISPSKDIQSWFPLGLNGLILLLSKGLSRVFSNVTVQKHQTLEFGLLYGPTLTSIHDYWKNHNFD